ncbi:MAG TPA: DUF4097 family beta strand repeat-containing protein [Vicinamibacterales bacterium]|nr:DUF4097 family beta strand repeat-containing protein [Vicinamibacterales bacterium]
MFRHTSPVPAAVALVALCLLPGRAAAQETERVERTLRLPENGTLSLRNFSGDVRITATTGRDVVIKAVRRATRDRLDHITLEITESGSTIAIEANRRDEGWRDRENNVVETEFDIQVPAAARLDVQVFSSDVTVTGVTARQQIRTFSGDITLEGATGALVLRTFNADIRADLTRAGNEPDIEAETFNGSIDVRLSKDARGRVEFSTFSGSLDSDVDLTLRSSRRRNTSADLPAGTGDMLRFKTFSGSLRIRN